MVGGGPGAFIGAVHRNAAALDGEIDLVAGSFSADPEKSRRQGAELHLDPDRVYDTFEEMAAREAELPENDRVDFVSIVAPNHVHYPAARAFIEAGFHVVCDKPLTTTLEEAEDLLRLVRARDVVFAVTHNYTGYPMVKQAREMVRAGEIGRVRKIVAEYPQGWLTDPSEKTGNKQAVWRTDPARAGSGAVGDIGSHAENLARYITGLRIERLCADITTFVPGRRLEDDANLLVHYESGVKGILYASQIASGEENNLRIRIYGDKGSLAWNQENPNYVYWKSHVAPERVYKHGNDYLTEPARHNSRLPFGHPEAFIEAFANIYRNAGRTIAARLGGTTPAELDLDFPTIEDGVRGVHFIQKALESGRVGGWVDARYDMPV
jgi:predicted dehydrogenase